MYLADPTARFIPGATIELSGDEARHAASVARLRVGERVRVSNGRGSIALTEAISVSPTAVSAVVIDVSMTPLPRPELWLVQALAKGGRDEQAIEQATELGVFRVIPWQAHRSISVWTGEKADKQLSRWQRIVQEAAKQALQPYTPQVAPLHSTEQLVELARQVSMVVLDPESQEALSDVARSCPDDRPIVLVVGPEGGISDEEIAELGGAGARTARLGSGILRTSTAGPVALAVVASHRGMWTRGDFPGTSL